MAIERFPVEASHIMMFARSVADPNPIYYDEDYAKGTEVGHIIAPPTFAQASAQFERTVNRDNTVSFFNRTLQIQPVRWRGTLAGCSVLAHQHLDGTLSLSYGPHCLGRYDASGVSLPAKASTELSRGRGTTPFPCNPIPKTNPTLTARAQL